MFDEADTDFSGRNAAGSSVDGYSSTAHSGSPNNNPGALNDSPSCWYLHKRYSNDYSCC